MADTPIVSVVIPTRNRRATLERCLTALAGQTYRSFEVIVVDDASTDDTPEFLADFVTRHEAPTFRWYRNETQAGANPSRNRAIHAGESEFVAFLDDDCIAEPDWLEHLMRGFNADNVAAVTGRVDDPAPSNVFELTFKGTHRVAGLTDATRLVAGNMCVQRRLLAKYGLDEDRAAIQSDLSVSGRGDEDGLFLQLRAAGFEQRVVPDAAVVHEHYYTGRSFFRQAFRGGAASARLGYKYYLPPRIELTPLLLAYLTLPLILLGPFGALVPAVFAAIFLAAILYNDLFRKRKTVIETLVTLPLLIAFYHVRMVGYWLEFIRLRVGKSGIRRVRLGRTAAPDA